MFDLFGYWGVVTFITVMAIFPFLSMVMPFVVHHFIEKVTGVRCTARRVRDNFFEYSYYNENAARRKSDYVRIFNRIVLHECWSIVFSAVGVFIIIGGIVINGKGDSPLDTVSTVATNVGPYVGEITILVILYYVGLAITKRGYKTYQKVEKVLARVNDDS